ncbi:MAG: neutral zinc metallopeptidase [Microscillaceae bacterium]|nr:neutral zinc metallopeptidase [Microscillaceae bacterium]
MRWQGRQGSENIEDRRSGGGMKRIGGGLGIGTVILAILAYFLGVDPSSFVQQFQGAGATQNTEVNTQQNDEMGQFVSVVLKDTEDVWEKLFPEQLDQTYQKPVLVLFDQSTESACGYASSATGPFYCPGDYKLYIDLSFYNELKDQFQAPGDFAMAYVVAHEVGHHIQKLLGITTKVQSQKRQLSEAEYNQLMVRLELQADFLAGVWAHHAQKMKNILEEGDIQEALTAANAIGDDRLQMQAQGYVIPDSFTHGTSEQRVRWFTKGFQTGDLNQGDTFSASDL